MQPKGVVAASQPQWISTKNRLPKNNETVLCVVHGKYQNMQFDGAYLLGEFWIDEGWILEFMEEWEDPTVTHWMPLPEPPREADHG